MSGGERERENKPKLCSYEMILSGGTPFEGVLRCGGGDGNGGPVSQISETCYLRPISGHLQHLPLIPLQQLWTQYPSTFAPVSSVAQMIREESRGLFWITLKII